MHLIPHYKVAIVAHSQGVNAMRRFIDLPSLRELPGFLAEAIRDMVRTRNASSRATAEQSVITMTWGSGHADGFHTVLTQQAVEALEELVVCTPLGELTTEEEESLRAIIAAGTFTFTDPAVMHPNAKYACGGLAFLYELQRAAKVVRLVHLPQAFADANYVPFTDVESEDGSGDREAYQRTDAQIAWQFGLTERQVDECRERAAFAALPAENCQCAAGV